MTRYVLGFVFNNDRSQVVLMRKKRPKWQAGLLNGVGGKIEDGETPAYAMSREFKEECGHFIPPEGWINFCRMEGSDWECFCYLINHSIAFMQAATMEEEEVEKHNPFALSGNDCVSNLGWLLGLALDQNNGRQFFATIRYQ